MNEKPEKTEDQNIPHEKAKGHFFRSLPDVQRNPHMIKKIQYARIRELIPYPSKVFTED
jgi:hypothetical protein